MVILGGLEIVAGAYLINKHVKNKKERARIEDERQRLEEEQYHLSPPREQRSHRHHRSHSERPHSRERRDGDGRRESRRRDSDDRKHPNERKHSHERRLRKENRPASTSPAPAYYKPQTASPRPPVQQPYIPSPMPQHNMPQTAPVIHHPVQPQAQQPPYPQDIKYGWTDNGPSSSAQNLQQGFPPTGWPAHWEQSQRPETPNDPYGRARSKSEIRPNESRVRFDLPGERSSSPPPRYNP
jgi:hypothetical protein